VNRIATALRGSHVDQKRFRDESVATSNGNTLGCRTAWMSCMKTGSTAESTLLCSNESRANIGRTKRAFRLKINGFGAADGQYMGAGIRLLELTRNMHRLFEKQQAAEKRRLLDFVVSNSVWKEGKIVPAWRQPFDMIALANESTQVETGGERTETGLNQNWLPGMDSNHELDRFLESHNLLILQSRTSRQRHQKQASGTKSVQNEFQ